MVKNILKNEERAILTLRELYYSYGYLPFKMSRFEEYELYLKNKEFLVSDSVITFNDTDGRLLALKPDVTLSIIKNATFEPGVKNKVFYNENVYRVSGSTHRFKEIVQTGLECIGDIDAQDIFEAVYLAAKSLSEISDSFALDISHMGIFSSLLDEASDDKIFKKEIGKLISEKNRHEARALCLSAGISDEYTDILVGFADMHGKPHDVLPRLLAIVKNDKAMAAYNELSSVCASLMKTEFYDRINLNFSLVGNMKYYNGIVFKGFLLGIFESVLSGGEYQMLMSRMGKRGSGIGFALYLDLLESFSREGVDADVDVLLIYTENCDIDAVKAKKDEIIASGRSVSCQRAVSSKIRYKEIIYMEKEGN